MANDSETDSDDPDLAALIHERVVKVKKEIDWDKEELKLKQRIREKEEIKQNTCMSSDESDLESVEEERRQRSRRGNRVWSSTRAPKYGKPTISVDHFEHGDSLSSLPIEHGDGLKSGYESNDASSRIMSEFTSLDNNDKDSTLSDHATVSTLDDKTGEQPSQLNDSSSACDTTHTYTMDSVDSERDGTKTSHQMNPSAKSESEGDHGKMSLAMSSHSQPERPATCAITQDKVSPMPPCTSNNGCSVSSLLMSVNLDQLKIEEVQTELPFHQSRETACLAKEQSAPHTAVGRSSDCSAARKRKCVSSRSESVSLCSSDTAAVTTAASIDDTETLSKQLSTSSHIVLAKEDMKSKEVETHVVSDSFKCPQLTKCVPASPSILSTNYEQTMETQTQGDDDAFHAEVSGSEMPKHSSKTRRSSRRCGQERVQSRKMCDSLSEVKLESELELAPNAGLKSECDPPPEAPKVVEVEDSSEYLSGYESGYVDEPNNSVPARNCKPPLKTEISSRPSTPLSCVSSTLDTKATSVNLSCEADQCSDGLVHSDSCGRFSRSSPVKVKMKCLQLSLRKTLVVSPTKDPLSTAHTTIPTSCPLSQLPPAGHMTISCKKSLSASYRTDSGACSSLIVKEERSEAGHMTTSAFCTPPEGLPSANHVTISTICTTLKDESSSGHVTDHPILSPTDEQSSTIVTTNSAVNAPPKSPLFADHMTKSTNDCSPSELSSASHMIDSVVHTSRTRRMLSPNRKYMTDSNPPDTRSCKALKSDHVTKPATRTHAPTTSRRGDECVTSTSDDNTNKKIEKVHVKREHVKKQEPEQLQKEDHATCVLPQQYTAVEEMDTDVKYSSQQSFDKLCNEHNHPCMCSQHSCPSPSSCRLSCQHQSHCHPFSCVPVMSLSLQQRSGGLPDDTMTAPHVKGGNHTHNPIPRADVVATPTKPVEEGNSTSHTVQCCCAHARTSCSSHLSASPCHDTNAIPTTCTRQVLDETQAHASSKSSCLTHISTMNSCHDLNACPTEQLLGGNHTHTLSDNNATTVTQLRGGMHANASVVSCCSSHIHSNAVAVTTAQVKGASHVHDMQSCPCNGHLELKEGGDSVSYFPSYISVSPCHSKAEQDPEVTHIHTVQSSQSHSHDSAPEPEEGKSHSMSFCCSKISASPCHSKIIVAEQVHVPGEEHAHTMPPCPSHSADNITSPQKHDGACKLTAATVSCPQSPCHRTAAPAKPAGSQANSWPTSPTTPAHGGITCHFFSPRQGKHWPNHTHTPRSCSAYSHTPNCEHNVIQAPQMQDRGHPIEPCHSTQMGFSEAQESPVLTCPFRSDNNVTSPQKRDGTPKHTSAPISCPPSPCHGITTPTKPRRSRTNLWPTSPTAPAHGLNCTNSRPTCLFCCRNQGERGQSHTHTMPSCFTHCHADPGVQVQDYFHTRHATESLPTRTSRSEALISHMPACCSHVPNHGSQLQEGDHTHFVLCCPAHSRIPKPAYESVASPAQQMPEGDIRYNMQPCPSQTPISSCNFHGQHSLHILSPEPPGNHTNTTLCCTSHNYSQHPPPSTPVRGRSDAHPIPCCSCPSHCHSPSRFHVHSQVQGDTHTHNQLQGESCMHSEQPCPSNIPAQVIQFWEGSHAHSIPSCPSHIPTEAQGGNCTHCYPAHTPNKNSCPAHPHVSHLGNVINNTTVAQEFHPTQGENHTHNMPCCPSHSGHAGHLHDSPTSQLQGGNHTHNVQFCPSSTPNSPTSAPIHPTPTALYQITHSNQCSPFNSPHRGTPYLSLNHQLPHSNVPNVNTCVSFPSAKSPQFHPSGASPDSRTSSSLPSTAGNQPAHSNNPNTIAPSPPSSINQQTCSNALPSSHSSSSSPSASINQPNSPKPLIILHSSNMCHNHGSPSSNPQSHSNVLNHSSMSVSSPTTSHQPTYYNGCPCYECHWSYHNQSLSPHTPHNTPPTHQSHRHAGMRKRGRPEEEERKAHGGNSPAAKRRCL